MTSHKTDKPNFNRLINDISFHPDRRVDIFLGLTPEERSEVILLLSSHIKKDLLTHLPDDILVDL